jgi:hypothetical protein
MKIVEKFGGRGSQRNNDISGKSFCKWVKDHLHQELGLPSSVEITERIATRWLHLLNYQIGDVSKKGMYLDGHNVLMLLRIARPS